MTQVDFGCLSDPRVSMDIIPFPRNCIHSKQIHKAASPLDSITHERNPEWTRQFPLIHTGHAETEKSGSLTWENSTASML